MTISEFAKNRNIQAQAVSRYISRHPELFAGHTKKIGKTIEIDPQGIDLLDNKYPIPRPVTVINGIPEEDHLRIISEKDAKIQELLELLARQKDMEISRLEEISELKSKIYILEDKSKQLEVAEERLESIKNSSLINRILKKF